MANKFLEVSVVTFFAVVFWLGVTRYVVWPFVLYFFPYSPAGIFVISYLTWLSYDIYTGFTIERKSNCIRKMSLWKYARDYFPARLIKTADLPEGRSYILVAHHHAIFPCSLYINLFSEANNVGELFPGIDFRGVIRTILYLPLFRDVCLSLGAIEGSESNIARLLQKNTSTGIVMAPGGAKGMPLSKPGSNEYKIHASKMKEFVKIALKTGSALVPVVSFGDTEALHRVEENCCSTKLLNFIPMVRTILPDGFRMINFRPKRFPLNTIVGEPITVPKEETPSSELIDKYHAQFYDAFRELFEKYKHEYSPGGSSSKLIIM